MFCITFCPIKLSLLPEIIKNNVDTVIMPSPPVWIRTISINCPNGLKVVPVSTTVRPVTQTADVEVNRASTNPSRPMVDAWGSISKQIPVKMRNANPKIVVQAGDRSNVFNICMIAILYPCGYEHQNH